MDPSKSGAKLPEVSVIMATRDRPRMLAHALEIYQRQTFTNRELLVIDDGDVFPAQADAVEKAGGRLIRVPCGTPIGTKLNQGAQEARAPLCQKMDDDDWYAPNFLEGMMSAFWKSQEIACRPVVAFLRPFLFFEVARWEVRRSLPKDSSGATLLFPREHWERQPFRPLPRQSDAWFLMDQTREGATSLPVLALESFLSGRHRQSVADRQHTWTHQFDGQTIEQHIANLPLYLRGPEDLVPGWALKFYRDLRKELLAAAS